MLIPAAVGIALSGAVGRLARRRQISPLAIRGARILITIVWVSFVAVGLSLAFGSFSFLSTLTVSAIAGIAVTLALQTTLQNLIAGFLLVRRRFLRYGDVVQISGVKGTVVSIGLVTSVVRTTDGTLAFISNSNLLAGPLLNYTASERLGGEY
ncbi:MAG TPA: mechanosensitive ion channel domain-containing protein [Thermoplasmata archaeon]|nr:mechanosensitive ion channel domain-containing protein [Thermoplasmata archaeon]HEV2317327.1 mechanosensitive ion channel domain-containing protein [Thermoplasmata archaeon]